MPKADAKRIEALACQTIEDAFEAFLSFRVDSQIAALLCVAESDVPAIIEKARSLLPPAGDKP